MNFWCHEQRTFRENRAKKTKRPRGVVSDLDDTEVFQRHATGANLNNSDRGEKGSSLAAWRRSTVGNSKRRVC